ncbi:hypothetical protein [Halosimplex carlsbadense]|uniref:hypothetical protein n=1 Tax=Halosimplex carlsbadense TaxID=171164 RepID=UPI0012686C8E|nr:hypothetical protein [Halosimplex carlsbadense]
MASPDRKRGILTTDDRDYLTGRKNLQSDSERNSRNRIRNRVRNGLYDFEYLRGSLEQRDVAQLATTDGVADEEVFTAAEDVIGFLFRLCAQAPDQTGYSAEDRFRELLQSGIKKGLTEDQELLDFKLDLMHGLPRERRLELREKIYRGKRLTMAELREGLENDYFNDSVQFKPLGENGLPESVDPMDMVSHDNLR